MYAKTVNLMLRLNNKSLPLALCMGIEVPTRNTRARIVDLRRQTLRATHPSRKGRSPVLSIGRPLHVCELNQVIERITVPLVPDSVGIVLHGLVEIVANDGCPGWLGRVEVVRLSHVSIVVLAAISRTVVGEHSAVDLCGVLRQSGKIGHGVGLEQRSRCSDDDRRRPCSGVVGRT